MTRAPATSCRRTLAAAGARPPRRPRAARLAACVLTAGILAATVGACAASDSASSSANIFATRQQVSLPQVEEAIGTVYYSHPGISSFAAQGIQYTSQSRDVALRECAPAEAGAGSQATESSQVIACGPLIFFLYSYGRKASVPASVNAAGKLYWYAITHITGQASARTSLDELLRSWKLPVPGLTPAEARNAIETAVVTAAASSILAQESVHIVITGRRKGGTATAEQIIADIGAATGAESIQSGAATATIRVTAKDAYFSGSPAGLTTFIGLTAPAARRAGSRWVEITKGTSEYTDLAAEDTIASLPASILPATGTAPQLRTAILSGKKIYVLDWKAAVSGSGTTVSERLILAATSQALPVSETTTANGYSQTVTLGRWGEHLTVPVPAAAIPYSRLKN